jgi:hypothetical protein
VSLACVVSHCRGMCLLGVLGAAVTVGNSERQSGHSWLLISCDRCRMLFAELADLLDTKGEH